MITTPYLISKLKALDLTVNTTAERAAKETYAVLCKLAEEEGQRRSEVSIRAPGEPRYFDNDRCWVVAWEAGPYQWAIPASMECFPRLVEPYYSFDLCFEPREWAQ